MNLDTALDEAERYVRFIPRHVREDAAQGARLEVWRHHYHACTLVEVRGWARRGAVDELRRMTKWRSNRTLWQSPLPRDPTDPLGWPDIDDADPADVVCDHLEAVDFITELAQVNPRALSMLLRHAGGETLAEIGASEGVTASRVSQILSVHTRRLPCQER